MWRSRDWRSRSGREERQGRTPDRAMSRRKFAARYGNGTAVGVALQERQADAVRQGGSSLTTSFRTQMAAPPPLPTWNCVAPHTTATRRSSVLECLFARVRRHTTAPWRKCSCVAETDVELRATNLNERREMRRRAFLAFDSQTALTRARGRRREAPRDERVRRTIKPSRFRAPFRDCDYGVRRIGKSPHGNHG